MYKTGCQPRCLIYGPDLDLSEIRRLLAALRPKSNGAAAAAAAAQWTHSISKSKLFSRFNYFFSSSHEETIFFGSKLIRTTVHTQTLVAEVALAPLSCCVPVRLKPCSPVTNALSSRCFLIARATEAETTTNRWCGGRK